MNAKKFLPWLIPGLWLFGIGVSAPFQNENPMAKAAAALPVLQEGRVKPLDTVARASLMMIQGKQTLSWQGRALSALQWLLDVMAKPEAADAYPSFRIEDPDLQFMAAGSGRHGKYFSYREFAPVRNQVLELSNRALALEAGDRSRFQRAAVGLEQRLEVYERLKNTLQSEETQDLPKEIAVYESIIRAKSPALRRKLGSSFSAARAPLAFQAFESRYLFMDSAAYFRPLPPAAGPFKDGWGSVAEALLNARKAGTVAAAAKSYADMLKAYRWGDAPAFRQAAASYASWLESAEPKAVRWARYELIFNEVEPFYVGMTLYLGVFLLALLSWLAWPAVFQRAAFRLLAAAFSFHTAGLLARIVLQGRPPVTNLYSSAVFVGWAAALGGMILEKSRKNGLGSAAAALIGFPALLIAHHLSVGGDTMEVMRAVLDSNFWLATHVVMITLGYGAAFLASALAHIYIFRGVFTPSLDRDSAKSLASMTYGVICFTLFFSFVGTVLGGIWADQSWGRFWGWDPKENGALLIVLWNAIILHARLGGYIRERGLMTMAVFGGIVTSLSWFGVNMLGIGLHSYGFTDQAFSALAAFILIELAVLAVGSAPASSWASFKQQV